MDPSLPASQLGVLSRRFERFGLVECKGSSPLYERLSLRIAADPEVLALSAGGQGPAPNLLFGAVHFMLLKGALHPLSGFYPSLSPGSPPEADPYPYFRSFCLEHPEEIRSLVLTRRVQTNEVGRCACLLPAFALVARLAGGRPLGLVEVGASAGLNLLWDRYTYDYGSGFLAGDPNSPIRITCALHGGRPPPIPASFPRVSFRVGLDLHPVDLSDPDAVLWLTALVWPEQSARAQRLRKAIKLAQADPPRVLSGDAQDLLPEVLAQVPGDSLPLVFNTFTLNQFDVEARTKFYALLTGLGKQRETFRVSIEWIGTEQPHMEMTAYRESATSVRLLAHCGPHGEWLDWFDEGSSDN